jgi:excisionase family DNA binding protein
MDRALTVEQLAVLLSMSKRTIYEHAASKRIPCFKIGSSVRFDPDELANWLSTR